MEFKSAAVAKHSPIRLQFYNCPPSEIIELNELEDYAVNRIRVLKCVEAVGQDCIRGNKEYEDKMITELTKIGGFGKIFTLCSSSTKNIKEDIRKDIISHFILQVAYCRSEDLRRWFVQQEVDLFRFRFLNERNKSASGPEVISKFLYENHLHFTHMSDSERSSLQRYLIAGTATIGIDPNTTAFYKVHFTEVPELVRSRRVFIQGGYAFVPDPDLVSLVVSSFRTCLSRNLAHLGLTLGSRIACEENRVLPLLSSLSHRYLGEDYSTKAPVTGIVKAEDVDGLARQPGIFPPCMSQLHEALKAHHHLRHTGRMQYGLFLKGIGLPWKNHSSFGGKHSPLNMTTISSIRLMRITSDTITEKKGNEQTIRLILVSGLFRVVLLQLETIMAALSGIWIQSFYDNDCFQVVVFHQMSQKPLYRKQKKDFII
ncbi:unnamed protein product [Heterobilharzia americana]|nr:unnamed protein product [Heterobilharzia americana]